MQPMSFEGFTASEPDEFSLHNGLFLKLLFFLAIWKPFIPVKLGEDGRVNALLEWSACEAEP